MSTIYTDEQFMLQSFIESGLVPAWRLNFAESIAREQRLSPKQSFWVKKIVDEIMAEASKPVVPVTKHDFTAIFNMFTTARRHLKFPKVRLETPVGHMKLSIASDTAKVPGSISVVLNRYGFAARIRVEGVLDITRAGEAIRQELTDFLLDFAKDPVKMAVEQGKLHSRCCFCYLPLKTQESLAVGYGDVCAKHYGLPWGRQRITDPQILEMPEAALALVSRR